MPKDSKSNLAFEPNIERSSTPLTEWFASKWSLTVVVRNYVHKYSYPAAGFDVTAKGFTVHSEFLRKEKNSHYYLRNYFLIDGNSFRFRTRQKLRFKICHLHNCRGRSPNGSAEHSLGNAAVSINGKSIVRTTDRLQISRSGSNKIPFYAVIVFILRTENKSSDVRT